MNVSHHAVAGATDPSLRRARMLRTFADRYGGEPDGWVRAPGRAELLGTDTDDHLGYVMTTSIHLDTWIAYRATDSVSCRLYSCNLEEEAVFEVQTSYRSPEATFERYVSGVAVALAARGYTVPGVEGVVHGTVPVGGGLSSSASLEIAVAHMFMSAGGFSVPPVKLAQAAQEAENQSAGVACGILDQYSSELGQEGASMLLDCRALTHVEVSVPSDIRIVICDTNFKRTLGSSDYGNRRAECDEATRLLRQTNTSIRTLRDVNGRRFRSMEDQLPETLRSRARFIVEENQRVVDFMSAVVRDDREAISALCSASYAGMRDLYEKTVPAMDHMYDAMTAAPGCIGARQSGGGFGGCMVAYVEASHVDAFTSSVRETYRRLSGIDAAVYPTWPSAGAGEIA